MARNIDADKLLEKQFFSLDDDGYGMMVVSVTDIISAPTVERKKGKWVEHRPNVYECTACNTWYGNYGGCEEWAYCPNCGADMRGDGDGNET